MQTSQEASTSGGGNSKQQSLEEYEKDYLARLEQQKIDDAKAAEEAAKAEVSKPSSNRGSLPKGF